MSANNMAASCRIVQRYNNEEKANRFTNKMIYPNPFLPLSVPKLSEGEGGAFFKLEKYLRGEVSQMMHRLKQAFFSFFCLPKRKKRAAKSPALRDSAGFGITRTSC